MLSMCAGLLATCLFGGYLLKYMIQNRYHLFTPAKPLQEYTNETHGTCFEIPESTQEHVPANWKLIHLRVESQENATCGAHAMANAQATIDLIAADKPVISAAVKENAALIFQRIIAWCQNKKTVACVNIENADWLPSEAITTCIEDDTVILKDTALFMHDGKIESFSPNMTSIPVTQINPITGQPARNERGELHVDPDHEKGFREKLIPQIKAGNGYLGGIHNTRTGNSHWVATVLDGKNKKIYFMDSLNRAAHGTYLTNYLKSAEACDWKIVDPWKL